MATKKIFAFGCEDAQLFEAGSPPSYTDIPGIQEAEFTFEVDKTEVNGDDDVLTAWYHSPKATLKLKAAVLDLDVLAAITGDTVSYNDGIYSLPIGTSNALNPSATGLRLKLKARDYSDSTPHELYLYIYSVIFSPPKFSGIKGGEALGVEIEGEAYTSTTDETGATLTTPARARFDVKEV